MRDTIYVTATHKMSYRGDTKETSEHRNSHNGCSTVLTELRSVFFWLCLCVAECSVDRRGRLRSNGANLLQVIL